MKQDFVCAAGHVSCVSFNDDFMLNINFVFTFRKKNKNKKKTLNLFQYPGAVEV